MGEELVILCRDAAGSVHVFLNSCRHRGMKVCRYEQGNTLAFICPYHAWTYTTDGKLQGVPLYRSLYEGHAGPRRMVADRGARSWRCKGTVWASWDKDAPDFASYMGDRAITWTRRWTAATAARAAPR